MRIISDNGQIHQVTSGITTRLASVAFNGFVVQSGNIKIAMAPDVAEVTASVNNVLSLQVLFKKRAERVL